jgi:HTH-type transcriptional regulator, transcriptional repressor of NAD biosynthesis genes
MSQRFRRGLVVGKFCPLHLGHELLIRHAQTQCDNVIVLSYTKPGFAGYDRERRAAWLQARFPQLECHVIDDDDLARRCISRGIAPRQLPDDSAPDEVHRRFVAWLLIELLNGPVDAVFTSEAYGDGFAAVLSHACATPVHHVCVDRARTAVPVSGTQVRRDPMACRHLLSPDVYADLVPRIALLGGESTGKTTLAQALARALDTEWVPEFGRQHWEQRGGVLTLEDMEHIGRTQVQWEQRQALAANRWLVCDTTPLTTLLYSELMFGRASNVLAGLARRSYTLTLLCAADFPFVQDGTRREESFRSFQQMKYEQALRERAIDWHPLQGTLERRIERAVGLIRGTFSRS